MLNSLLLKLEDYLRARVVLDSLTSIDSTLRSKPKMLHQEKVSPAFYLKIYSKQIISRNFNNHRFFQRVLWRKWRNCTHGARELELVPYPIPGVTIRSFLNINSDNKQLEEGILF